MSKRRRRSYYDDEERWSRFESRSWPRTIPAEGIKAKSQRGKFAESWWAERWIKALTRLMDSGRLSRGRSYARRGQVLNIDINLGEVGARVQGSRRTPYKVKIELQPLSDREWARVFDALADQALFAAQLLNEEMPQEIEEVFAALDIPLFPSTRGDLTTTCSCPDYANPCKHIAAVHYLLAERFDEDPFLLFELRGRTQQEVVTALRTRRAASAPPSTPALPMLFDMEQAPTAPTLETLAEEEDFWRIRGDLHAVLTRPHAPKVELALLKRVGLPAFAEPDAFRAQMERVYPGITEQALAEAERE